MNFFTTNGLFDRCPICGTMILPKNMGGRKHIESHKYSEANRYFDMGYSLQRVQQTLMNEDIMLFNSNYIHPKLQDVTSKTKLLIEGKECHMVRISENDCLEFKDDKTGRTFYYSPWDKRLLDKILFVR